MATIAYRKANVTAIDGLTRKLNPQEYVDEVVRQSGSSFYWPMKFLPQQKRDALASIYAFCRILDDEVDNNSDVVSALKNITMLAQELDIIYQDESLEMPTHPVAQAVLFHVRKFKLPKKYFDSIIEGFQMDLAGTMLRPTLSELDKYCNNVASSVGLLAIEIFGYKNESSLNFAISLGKFMQLINIIRDVNEDAQKGRIYLPLEILENHGIGSITPAQIRQNPYDQRLLGACGELGLMAEKYLESANANLSLQDKQTLRPAIFMQNIYSHYLNVMKQNNWHFDREDLSLSFLKKMKIYISG